MIGKKKHRKLLPHNSLVLKRDQVIIIQHNLIHYKNTTTALSLLFYMFEKHKAKLEKQKHVGRNHQKIIFLQYCEQSKIYVYFFASEMFSTFNVQF